MPQYLQQWMRYLHMYENDFVFKFQLFDFCASKINNEKIEPMKQLGVELKRGISSPPPFINKEEDDKKKKKRIHK